MLLGNEAPVPAHQGIGSDDARELSERSSPELLSRGREPAALGVGQNEVPSVKLLLKDAVFFQQVVDDVLLPALDETGQCEYEKLEGKVLGRAAHSLRFSVAFMRELRPESNDLRTSPDRQGPWADRLDLALFPGDRVFGQDGVCVKSS